MKNEKATWQGGSNQNLIVAGGKSNGFDVCNFNIKANEKQLISSGEIEKLAEDLTSHLKQHRVIRIRTSCKHCRRPFAQQKLVTDLMLCQECLADARTAPLPKRNRILAEVIRNYTATFQRRVCVGGQHI